MSGSVLKIEPSPEGLPRITPEHLEAARQYVSETPSRLVADVLLHAIAMFELQFETNLFVRSRVPDSLRPMEMTAERVAAAARAAEERRSR